MVAGSELGGEFGYHWPESWRAGGTEHVSERLLRVGQRGQERRVGEQWHDLGLVPVKSLKRGVPKGLVPEDRTADRGAVLCSRVSALAGIEVVPGLEASVAENAKEISVQLVRATLGHDVDRAARSAALLGREGAAVDLELLHRLLADRRPDTAGVVQVVQAVNHERVGAPIRTANTQSRRGRGRNAAILGVGDVFGINHPWG